MKFLKRFTFPKNHEPEKKYYEWTLSEEKILLPDEKDKLRAVCKKLKTKGLLINDFHLVRSWFVIELGLFTGLRVGEMTQLKIKDIIIDKDHSSIFVRHGKGGKQRSVWINRHFKRTCNLYLKTRDKFGLSNDEENFLLTSQQDKPLTVRALQKEFKICTKKAGLAKHYSIHCLRHTYGTFLMKACNNNIKLVKEQMGHSTIKTTEIYIALIQEDTKLALEGLYR